MTNNNLGWLNFPRRFFPVNTRL